MSPFVPISPNFNQIEVNSMYFIRDYYGPAVYKPSSNPDVMILGQDPTVDTTRRFSTVLGLENADASNETESKSLQRYIRKRILEPLNINNLRIIAVNLVNAYYYDVPNKIIAKTYKDLILENAKNKGINTKKYPDKTNGAILHALNFECQTRKDFERLINLYPIRHIITLGEPVFQVIRERYDLNLEAKISDILKAIDSEPPIIPINNKEVSLLPLPHISSANREFYKQFLKRDLIQLSPWYER